MYSSLEQALLDLEKAGMLRRIREEVDPYLEMAEIARQAFDSKGPALLFESTESASMERDCTSNESVVICSLSMLSVSDMPMFSVVSSHADNAIAKMAITVKILLFI